MGDKITLSIVIPTKNREKMLDMCLQSIVDQKAEESVYEVIVVDNGSTDNTHKIATSYQNRIKNFHYIYDARPGLHVGRNRGMQESRGVLVGYLDDDVILFPDWINAVLKAFEDEQVMRVGGSVIPYDMNLLTKEFRKRHEVIKGSYHFIYCISCFWQRGISENDKRVDLAKVDMGFGGNSVYRKNVLSECKGFHPDGMPKNLLMYRGDGETYVSQFMQKHKMKELYCAQASVYHMIDANRIDDSYIDYMYFRNGISAMYTSLRVEGLREGIKSLYLECKGNGFKRRDRIHYLYGKLYLFIYYLFYKRVRKWVHKESYF